MVEKKKKQMKKRSISEQDISTIFQKYNATQVLAVLQEVAQVQDIKIDWNELVRNTTSGISNPREYQMLWRHLAYREPLLERFEDGAKPLDDDSDLECELVPFPTVSTEASTEAVACVKVMIASGLPSDSNLMNGLTVEAPLTINIPNSQLSRSPSENSQLASAMSGTNITVPVSVQKQPLPTVTSVEPLDVNGASANGNLPPRRKRKPWTTEEDDELIAAVQKLGEGSWANILKADFKGDRTASQLSQRWTIIKKRKGNMNGGGGSQEAISATRHAVSLALNMPPIGDKLKASSLTAGMTPTITPIISSHPTVPETSSAGTHARNQAQQDLTHTSVQKLGLPGSSSRSRAPPKKPLIKPSASVPDSGVHLAAVAAGARIASPSDAASILKATQGKKAIHIIPGGGSKISSSNPLPNHSHLASHPNVHYIRTSVTPTVPSTYSTVPPNASRPHLGLGKTSKTAEDIVSSSSKEFQENKEAFAGHEKKEESQEIVGLIANGKTELVQEGQASPIGFVSNSKCSSGMETGVNGQMVGAEQPNDDHKISLLDNNEDVNHPVPMEIHEEQKEIVKEEDSMAMIVDGRDEKIDIKGKAATGTDFGDVETQTA